MNSWDEYLKRQKEIKEKHSKPHKLSRKRKDGSWHECGNFENYDTAYKNISYWNDGRLTWDDFKIEPIEKGNENA